MNNVYSIVNHPQYTPKRVISFVYFLLDKRLNDKAKEIYHFLLKMCKEINGRLYCTFGSVEELKETFQRFEANELKKAMTSMTELSVSVTSLRKFQYIKFVYDQDLQAKVVILPKHVGDLV